MDILRTLSGVLDGRVATANAARALQLARDEERLVAELAHRLAALEAPAVATAA